MSDPQQPVSLKQFFEETPPGNRVPLADPPRLCVGLHGSKYYEYELPTLELHCESESCQGTRFFDTKSEPRPELGRASNHFSSFICRNCGSRSKTYAFRLILAKEGTSIDAQKYGEFPPFGPPTPARLMTLVGSEREYFLKGRRAENQGLGIAAFAYYRRVVENQRNRIFDEIIRVAKRLRVDTAMLQDLELARNETQFSRAVESIKHGIPQALLIDGHNPLLLLHAALSEGLHAQTDQECLEIATSIRVVLAELVERTSNALKEEAALQSAVSRLLSAKGPK